MRKSVSISLCMIVKDEAKTLARCLDSIKDIIDEIIIVDTGSTDNTKEIAKSFGAKLFDFVWQNDFSLARNFAFRQATGTYVMWLDGDDFIPDEYKKNLKNIVDHLDGTVDYVSAEYILGRTSNGEISYSLRRNRIVKREMGFKWIGKIHEYLEVYGNSLVGDFAVEHGKVKGYTDRNLQIFKEMERKKNKFSPRDLYYYGNELRDHAQYKEAIKKYKEFIETKRGWKEDVKGAYASIIKCYKQLGETEKIVDTALEAFRCEVPRADICCHLADYYMEKQLYEQAEFWYRVTFECKPEPGSLGIDDKSYYTWIPSLQLCMCYFYMGKLGCAYFFNELAAEFKSDLAQIAHNRKYFLEEFERRGESAPTIPTPIRMSDYVNYL